jgi:hypothetical protein
VELPITQVANEAAVCDPGAELVRISVPLTLMLSAVLLEELVKVKLPDAAVVVPEPPLGPVFVFAVTLVSVKPPGQAEAPPGGVTVQVIGLVDWSHVVK